MKLKVKKGNIEISHEDDDRIYTKHSETIIKLLKEMVDQAIKLKSS